MPQQRAQRGEVSSLVCRLSSCSLCIPFQVAHICCSRDVQYGTCVGFFPWRDSFASLVVKLSGSWSGHIFSLFIVPPPTSRLEIYLPISSLPMSSNKAAPKRSLAKIVGKQNDPDSRDIQAPASSPSRPARKAALKRKSAPVISDSDIEIVSVPVSPKKKKTAARPPSPGEVGFNELPPVTISKVMGAPASPSKKQMVAVRPLSPEVVEASVKVGSRTSPKKKPIVPHPPSGDDIPATVLAKVGSPKKKTIAARPPSPGEEGYEDLPAVSIAAKVGAALRGSKTSITYGTISGSDNKAEDSSPLRARSSRVRVKSEKARLIEESQVIVSGENNVPATSSHSRAKDLDVSDDDLLPDTTLPVNVKSSPHAPTLGNRSPIINGTPSTKKHPFFVEVDEEDVSDVGSPTRSAQNDISSKPDTTVDVFDPVSDAEEVAESVAASDANNDSSEEEAGAGDANDESAEPEEPEEDDEAAVMRQSLQDQVLYEIYENLPVLATFRDVRSYSQSESNESSRISFSRLAEVLPEWATDCILKGLLFVQSDCFVNTARIHPTKLVVDGGRLKLAGSPRHAVGIMLGAVTESFLIEPGSAGSPMNPFTVHKITIAPFAQEMRRDTSMWGRLFDFNVMSGSVSSLGISFLTRKDGSGFSQGPASPAKSGGIFTTVSSPLVSKSTVKNGSYPASRAFSDKVPIYDGRKTSTRVGFQFTDAHFRDLMKWPLYKDGKREVPENAVVAVGYTLSTYVGSNSGARCLSSNIQFVILLGLIASPA